MYYFVGECSLAPVEQKNIGLWQNHGPICFYVPKFFNRSRCQEPILDSQVEISLFPVVLCKKKTEQLQAKLALVRFFLPISDFYQSLNSTNDMKSYFFKSDLPLSYVVLNR